jgi:hypothetical protein
VSDKRIPKPGEVWGLVDGKSINIVNVYPDCLTYNIPGVGLWSCVMDKFLGLATPPEPTVVSRQHLLFNHDTGNFVVVTTHFHWVNTTDVGTIAAMSDGTFRFEAAS